MTTAANSGSASQAAAWAASAGQSAPSKTSGWASPRKRRTQPTAMSAWLIFAPYHQGSRRAARGASLACPGREHAADLRAPALDPERRLASMDGPLLDQADRLVRQTAGKRANLQGLPPFGAALGHQRPLGTRDLVQPVEDGGALDQHLPPFIANGVQDQGRHALERIVGGDLRGLREHPPGAVLVGHSVATQRD